MAKNTTPTLGNGDGKHAGGKSPIAATSYTGSHRGSADVTPEEEED